MTSPTVAYLRFEPPSTLMHWTRRAPELSATSRFVCIWIMVAVPLARGRPGVGDDLPALALGDRPALANPHGLADLVGVRLVVRGIFLRATHELLVDRMHDAALDLDDDGLVHLVAHDHALKYTLGHSRHSYDAARAKSFNRVWMRAISRRTWRTRAVFSSWPLAFRKRRLNASFFEAVRSPFSWSGLLDRRSSIFMVQCPSPRRVTKRVFTESLAAASSKASSAIFRGTPSISNMIRPGWMRATQYSGVPLPLPMRTSAGLRETGTSGKTRIHTRPTRFRWRVTARRAASIWRAVMWPGSVAFRP